MPASILRCPFENNVTWISICFVFSHKLTRPALLLIVITDKPDLRCKSFVGVEEALISIPVPDHILFTVDSDLLDICSQSP